MAGAGLTVQTILSSQVVLCSRLCLLLTEMLLLTRSLLWLSAIVPTPEERADVRLAAVCGLSKSVRNVLELPFTTFHYQFPPNPLLPHHLAPTFLIFLLSTSHISPSDTSYFSSPSDSSFSSFSSPPFALPLPSPPHSPILPPAFPSF